MPVHVHWDDERQAILRWDFHDDWSWEDASAAADVTKTLIDHPDTALTAAVLLNMEAMESIPRDSLRTMRRLFTALRPDDLIIVCGSSDAVDVMMSFLRSIFRSSADTLHSAPSLDHGRVLALQYLAGYKPDAPTEPSRPAPP